MEQKRIGLFILSLRKEKNLTQKELADQLGVTDRAVSKWENGRGLPDVSLMKALCDVLDITVNELLSGERIDQGDYREKSEQAVLKTMESSDKTIRKKNALLWALTIGVMLLILAAVLSVYMNPVERPFFRADEEIGISLILKTVPNNETVVPYAYSNFDYADITDEIDTERLVQLLPLMRVSLGTEQANGYWPEDVDYQIFIYRKAGDKTGEAIIIYLGEWNYLVRSERGHQIIDPEIWLAMMEWLQE